MVVMRPWFLPLPLVVLALGCAKPDAPALQPGDVVRPEIAVAPEAPWPGEGKANVGVLLRVVRAGGETHYLMDEEVDLGRMVMSARFTFLDGERVVQEQEVPLVHDC
jgi:hypothetical protein